MSPKPAPYRDAAAFRMALEQRLKESATTPAHLARLRKAVVFERFLARLVWASTEGWVLKGAFVLDLRYSTKARSTKDIDLATERSAASASELLDSAAALRLDDFFAFAVEQRSSVPRVADQTSSRYHVVSSVDRRPFEAFSLDVVAGEPAPGKPELLKTPGYLEFAGIAPVEVPAVPLAQHLAEKLHAYLRTYARGRRSTRPKDLVDILIIAEGARELRANQTIRALEAAFGDAEIPNTFPHPPASWATPFRILAAEVAVAAELEAAHNEAARFVEPLLKKTAKGVWHASDKTWR